MKLIPLKEYSLILTNNIFLWHKSEDINKKKKLISKISVDSNFNKQLKTARGFCYRQQ